MKARLVNCSSKYNLGLAKYANWLRRHGWKVESAKEPPLPLFAGEYDLVGFGALFSWDVPALIEKVNLVKSQVGRIEIGGPGTLELADHIERETGIAPLRGLDSRFEQEPGDYAMTFSSRGCPGGCTWCIVPSLEGTKVIPYADFSPASKLLDNNILAAEIDHQERVIETLLGHGYPQVDFVSGFEAARLDDAAFRRFSQLPLAAWRLAYDRCEDQDDVRRAIRVLRSHGVRARLIRVYVMIGNESPGDCLKRAQQVIQWGGEPFVQPLQPLDCLSKNSFVPDGWSDGEMQDMARYFNRFGWRSRTWEEYDRHYRRQGGAVQTAAIGGYRWPSNCQ